MTVERHSIYELRFLILWGFGCEFPRSALYTLFRNFIVVARYKIVVTSECHTKFEKANSLKDIRVIFAAIF